MLIYSYKYSLHYLCYKATYSKDVNGFNGVEDVAAYKATYSKDVNPSTVIVATTVNSYKATYSKDVNPGYTPYELTYQATKLLIVKMLIQSVNVLDLTKFKLQSYL